MSRVVVNILAPVGSPSAGQLLFTLSEAVLRGLTFSTTLPGGYAGCHIQIAPGVVPYTAMRYYAHVEVRIGGALVWEGRASDWSDDSGYVVEIPAEGYYFQALDDHAYSSTSTSVVTSGTVLRTIIQASAPALTLPALGSTLWNDSQGQHALSDYDGTMPSADVTDLAKEGHISGYPLDFAVYAGRVFQATVRVPPTVPDYQVNAFYPGLKRQRSAKASYGGVSYDYNASDSGTATITTGNTSVTVSHRIGTTPDPSEITLTFTAWAGAANAKVQNTTTTTFDVVLDVAATGTAAFGWAIARKGVATSANTDDTFNDRMGIARNIRLKGGTMTNVAAELARDTALAARTVPTIATSLELKGGLGLPTPTGALVPQEQIRSGQTLRVADQDPTAAFLDSLSQFIVHTECNPLAGTINIECGAVFTGLATLLHSLRKAGVESGQELAVNGGRNR